LSSAIMQTIAGFGAPRKSPIQQATSDPASRP
jgi:hypothetical protein